MSKNSTSSWGESITCANLAHVCAAADATSSVLELVQKVICKLCILLFSLMLKLMIFKLLEFEGVTVANFATVQSELWNRSRDSKLAFL